MENTEYSTKESLLYIVYDQIEKVCTNRYIIINEKDKKLIDVEGNELIIADKDNESLEYMDEHIIYGKVKNKEKEYEYNILDGKTLRCRYKTNMSNYMVRTELTVKKFGKFLIVSSNRSSIILDENDKVVIDSEIIDCTYNKVWFSNGYHIRGRVNSFMLENNTIINSEANVEVVTNYEGTDIIYVLRQSLSKGIDKVFNVRSKKPDKYIPYGYDSIRKYKDNIKVDVGLIINNGNPRFNGYSDIYGCITARDLLVAEKIKGGKVYRTCLSKFTGQELIEPRLGIKTFKQINSDMIAIVYEDINDGIEIISIKNGLVLQKGIMNTIETKFTFLPIVELSSINYSGSYIIGNDYKLYSIDTKDISKYNVEDFKNAYDISQRDDGNYTINILGDTLIVNHRLELMLELAMAYNG